MQSESSPKSDAYDALVAGILTLDLAPGADLDEARLCAEHGLSRTPMREVLRQLAGEGYVTLRQNRGAQVSEMSHASLRAFFIAAPMIYAAILQLAAENRTPAQVVELAEAQDVFIRALRNGSTADRALANDRFHHITGEMADNPFLLPSFNRLLLDHARISMTFYAPRTDADKDTIKTARDHHEQIIEAIDARDATRAGELAQAHWALSRDRIAQFVMPGGLDLPLGPPPQEARL
ncbi:GntR family transcriptional regulator [Tateyamaria omphalii]|uniref:GntR family transcriptional regulator n=1 Tax=Tateyamaria omphalii TaxID=299262 RepID=UPI00167B143D|nr:GntR family transcriptional regulator [Tateyamaria omphalii]GGX68307.1 GntR family transcriptional regulator [Tateyamaria omphalii]